MQHLFRSSCLLASFRSRAVTILLACLLSNSFVAGATATHALQPLETIAAAAREYATANGLKAGTRRTIESAPLDSRLRLAVCPSALATAAAPGARSSLRMTVEVRCPVDGGWRLFVPVKIKAFDTAVVATRALPRGHVLSAADLSAVESDVSALPPGYARDAAPLLGRRVVRPLVAGGIVGSSTLAVEPTVRRGQAVTLLARGRGISVRMQGVALGSAGIDDRIKIKNLSSGREVDGVVRSEALVEIVLR